MPSDRIGNHPEDAEIRFFTGTWELYPAEELAAAAVVELDLGCGVGSYTAELAKRYPERKILAADVMVGRLRKLVKRCRRMGIGNMTILRTEARHLVAFMLPDESVDRLHLLCPDPWPKGRHSGHRLLTSDFVSQLHRVLKKDGIFHFSSDDEPYSRPCAASWPLRGFSSKRRRRSPTWPESGAISSSDGMTKASRCIISPAGAFRARRTRSAIDGGGRRGGFFPPFLPPGCCTLARMGYSKVLIPVRRRGNV